MDDCHLGYKCEGVGKEGERQGGGVRERGVCASRECEWLTYHAMHRHAQHALRGTGAVAISSLGTRGVERMLEEDAFHNE